MTGLFAPASRDSICVSLNCNTVITLGELVYLFKKSDRQTICLACAKARWGYEPSDEVPTSTPAKSARESIGFDSTKTILTRLQLANANDPKMRQAGDR